MVPNLTRNLPLFALVTILVVGATREFLSRYEISASEAVKIAKSWILREPQFRLLCQNRESKLRYGSYTFQSLDGPIKYADDCIGCYEMVGDTHVLHSFVSPEESEAIFDRYVAPSHVPTYRQEIIIREALLGKDGSTIGRRALLVNESDGKKEVVLFWTENGEFWSIASISKRHVLTFETSEHFSNIRSLRN
jgi:hypothetical protein